MSGQFLVACGEAAKLLEAAEKPLDGMALGVAGRLVGPWVAAFAPGRNHGTDAAGSERGHERVRVVGAVSHHIGWRQALQQGQGLGRVMAWARRQAAAHEPAPRIGHHVPFARQAATAAPQGLRSVFLRAPLAC